MDTITRRYADISLQRYVTIVQKNQAKSAQLKRRHSSVTSIFVRALARREGVKYKNMFADNWASAVTRLAGDTVHSDSTDDLLVALARSGKITTTDQLSMLVAHHRRGRV
ncbi:hypothetical protein [Castellaniella sp.]|uniref:hypothetical protein n=1 Tax=Castellaniella sp. TaxID=1955812 RepID=UPI003A8F704C